MFRTRSKSTSGHKRSTLDHTKSRTAGRNFFPPDETGFQQETITIGRSKLPNCRPRFLPPVPKSVSAGNDRDPSLQSFESPLVLSFCRSKSFPARKRLRAASGSFEAPGCAFLPPFEINFRRKRSCPCVWKLSNRRSSFPAAERSQLPRGNDQVRHFKASYPPLVLSFRRSKPTFARKRSRPGLQSFSTPVRALNARLD